MKKTNSKSDHCELDCAHVSSFAITQDFISSMKSFCSVADEENLSTLPIDLNDLRFKFLSGTKLLIEWATSTSYEQNLRYESLWKMF